MLPTNRRAFLIGTALAGGAYRADAVAALKGRRRSVLIPTHEFFGDIEERLDFPRAWEVNVLEMAGHNAPVLRPEEIRKRIQSPIGSRPLRELAAGKKRVVVTFDDLQRPTPAHEVAYLVVEELKAAGVADEQILLLTSFGTHRAMEQDDVIRKIGKELPRRYAWINHNIWENLKDVGQTSYKNRILVNQTFAAADLKVTVSGIKVHEGAGYGGGAKAVLPGVAGMETIYYNHQVISRANKTVGQLKIFKNDQRLDMVEAARLAGVDFSVQIVYNGRRRTVAVFAGDLRDAHHAACRMANRHYRTPMVQNADIVVANGYPQNAQATRGVGLIGRCAREGGSGVLIIQNPQGISAWHFLNQRSSGRGGRTYWETLEKPGGPMARGVQVILYSQYFQKQLALKLPPGALLASTWAEVIAHLQKRHKGDARVAVYPYSAIQHPETDLDEG